MSDLNEYLDNLKRQQRGAQDMQLNSMMNSVGLDSSGAAIPDWTPKPKADPNAANLRSTSGLVRSVEDIWLGMREGSAGAYHLGANVFGLADKAADKISQWTGMPKGGGAAMVASFLKDAAVKTAPTEQDLADRDHFGDYIYRAIGSAPVTIGEYVAGGVVAGSNIAGMALIDALRHTDQGTWEAIKGGLKGALMSAGLKAIEPFSRPIRAVLGGAGFGGLTAAEGGKPSEIAAQTVVGAGMSALGETKARETKPVTTPAPTNEGPVRVPKSEVIRQPDLTQKSAPIPQPDLTTKPPAVRVPKSEVIRQPDLTQKSAPIPQPDLTTKPPAEPLPDLVEGKPDPVSNKMAEELESARIEADAYVREKGWAAMYEPAKKQTTDARLRKEIARTQQRIRDEEMYGDVESQLRDPNWLYGEQTPSPAEASAQVFEDAAAKEAALRQSPEGADLLKQSLDTQSRTRSPEDKTALQQTGDLSGDFSSPSNVDSTHPALDQPEKTPTEQPQAAASTEPNYAPMVDKVERAAGELDITPQNVLTGVKAVDMVTKPAAEAQTPTVTATNGRTGKTETFEGTPGSRHADVVLEHNLDSGGWEINSSNWKKGMPVTGEEAGALKALGTAVKDIVKKLKDQEGAIKFDPSRRKFLKGAAGVIGAAAAPTGTIGKALQAMAPKMKSLGVVKYIYDTLPRSDSSGTFILSDGTKIYYSFDGSDRQAIYDIVLPNKKIYSIDSSVFDYEHWDGVADANGVVNDRLKVSAEHFAESGLPKSILKYVELVAPLEEGLDITPAPGVAAKLSDIRQHTYANEYGTLDVNEVRRQQRQVKESMKGMNEQIEEHAKEREANARVQEMESNLQSGKGQVYNVDEQGRMTAQGDESTPTLFKESGFSTFDINFAIARTLAGAAYGFSQGDTIEERLKNALMYGGFASLANPRMIKTIYQTLRGIDPQGIKAVETRDAGYTSTISQSFDASAKTDPKAMAEFLRMTNEGLVAEGRVDGINYDHINTPMDVKYTIGKMARVYQSELDKVRKVDGVSHEKTVAAAERLAEVPGAGDKILKWPDGKPMTDRELLFTRMLRNDLGKSLQDVSGKFLNEPSQENLVSFIDTFNRYRMVQTVYGGQASGRGRGLEALKIDVGNSGEVEFHRMLGDVVQAVDPTGWTAERLAGAIAQVRDIDSLNKAAEIAARPGMHDMLLEAMYGTAFLSNPKTWVVNAVGAPMAMAWQVAKRSIAGGFSAATGKMGDPNYVQPVEPLMMLQSIKDSYHDAFTIAKEAFVKGERQYPYSYGGKASIARPNAITYDNAKALYPKAFDAAESALGAVGIDAQKLKYGIDLLGETARISTRLMLAPDEFNELIGARMELYARTARSTAAEGLSLSEIAQRAREKIANQEGLSSADKEAAKQFALYNTFNQEPGSFTTRLTGTIESLNKSPDIDPVWYLASKVVVPFITIPANIGRWAARESGPTAFLSRDLKNQMAKGGAEAQTAWAGVALGSMVLTLAANMAMNGNLQGVAPVQKADRLVFEADGNMEYSVKTPIGSFGINRLDPIAIPFAWAADFVNLAGHVDAYDSLTLASAALLTMTHDMASKNYVQGLTNFMHAITSGDPKEIQAFVKGEVGSLLVPGIVRGVRQETDPYRRATNTAFESARSQTPWGSTDYPTVLDRFARPVYSGYGAGQGWVSMFGIINPIQYRAPNENRVINEITGNKIPIPGLSDTIYGSKDNPFDNKPPDSRTGIKLENWEYYQYNKYSGDKLFELLSKEVDTPRWKRASPGPDGGKASIFGVLVAAADEYARQRLLRESPELEGAMKQNMAKRREALKPIQGGQIQVPQ